MGDLEGLAAVVGDPDVVPGELEESGRPLAALTLSLTTRIRSPVAPAGARRRPARRRRGRVGGDRQPDGELGAPVRPLAAEGGGAAVHLGELPDQHPSDALLPRRDAARRGPIRGPGDVAEDASWP